MRNLSLMPHYSTSHALLIGINKYQKTSGLTTAVNDVNAVAGVLTERLGFESENVRTLLDDEATREEILSCMYAFRELTDENSRFLVYFGGHGTTVDGNRGEQGFLVPVEGDCDRLETLIEWSQLVKCADLVPAKHVLFIMDACYGGLVLTRAPAAGTRRYLKDLLKRPVRQAITAGKFDQVVDDLGGARPGHSMFAGHLLEGLDGSAINNDGVLTAMGLVGYMCRSVGQDPDSRQTPHYGLLSGDGDFVFTAPELNTLREEVELDQDVLVSISSGQLPAIGATAHDPVSRAKELLPTQMGIIALDDLVTQLVRKAVDELGSRTSKSSNLSSEALIEQLSFYEEVTADLRHVAACIAHWGADLHRPTLEKAFSRFSDYLCADQSTVRSCLEYYPVMLLCYAGGIGAIARKNYANLATIFSSTTWSERRGNLHSRLALIMGEVALDFARSGLFKRLPGHEKFYEARSEYLWKFLQPELETDLFLGKEYERLFDKFEVFLALDNAVSIKEEKGRVWGPLGRFSYKFEHGLGDNPLREVAEEIRSQKSEWPPLKAGMFGGSYDSLNEALDGFTNMVGGLGRW